MMRIMYTKLQNYSHVHCVKIIQIRSFFWSVFSRIRTEYGPEITPYLDTFHALVIHKHSHIFVSSAKTATYVYNRFTTSFYTKDHKTHQARTNLNSN